MIDAKQLGTLLDVVRCGSFSAAAKVRGVSQPAISLAISLLERQIGQRLLDRGPQGIEPTRAGRILVRRAEAIENQIALAADEIGLDARGIAGPLRIAGTPGALISVVPSTVALLERTDALGSISIQEASDGDLLTLLRAEAVDLTVGTLGFEGMHADIREIELIDDSFDLVVRHDHALAGTDVELRDTLGEGWVLPNRHGAFRRQVDLIFIDQQLTLPARLIRCDSLATTKELVRQTNHITLLPQRVVTMELQTGAMRAIALRRPIFRRLGLRLLAKSFGAPLLHSFIGAALAAVGKGGERMAADDQ